MKSFGRRRLAATVALTVSAAVLSACGGSTGGSTTSLLLAGFAAPKAGNNAAQAAFAKTDAGKGVV